MPEGASFCRECGSDDTTGWSEETVYDGLDLPEVPEPVAIPDTFEEFAQLVSPRRRDWRLAVGLLLLALALLIAFT